MEENKNTSEKLVDAVSNWIDTYRNILILRAAEHSSQGASISIFGILAMLVAIFILLFSGLGAAWWIGEKLENMKAGFFIVGGAYVIVLIVLLLTAKKLLIPGIRNLIIKKIYEQD
jgi:peptidoglycan biosynthesis protein MviN/MurJ (putative lipid II flippase)